MKKFTEHAIIASWQNNTDAWISAIRDGEIESRLVATNTAIVNAVLDRSPRSVLDVGCGEGWLVRELVNHGIDTLGIDVNAEFIDFAKRQGIGRYLELAFEELSTQTLKESFDLAVCNFSLLGDVSVNHIFEQMPYLLNSHGTFIVQTVHPVIACGHQPYKDGWREGSWTGFSEKFHDPAPWYFRTLETWKALFTNNGFTIREILEPPNPKSRQPCSILITGDLND